MATPPPGQSLEGTKSSAGTGEAALSSRGELGDGGGGSCRLCPYCPYIPNTKKLQRTVTPIRETVAGAVKSCR